MTDVLLLLVEDEALLHAVLEDALAEAGFKVLIASSGKEAVKELNADAQRFSGVLTDIRLGKGPTGWEVGQLAREVVKDMPIVYMSGDSGHEWASKGVPNSVMIGKPFAMAQVITAISQLLNDQPPTD